MALLAAALFGAATPASKWLLDAHRHEREGMVHAHKHWPDLFHRHKHKPMV